jgi:uncharacterized protein YbjT (DUF2867 family)
MHIVIAGGHGTIALHLTRQLSASGHTIEGLIRNPDQADEIRAAGGKPVVFDLESATATELASRLTGADAVVFAAGSGPNSGPERKLTVDRDGAILLAAAAESAGVQRMVVVSAMSADSFDPESDDIFQIYLRAKAEADAAVRASRLDWTIVRPGGLTDEEPTGLVTAAETVQRGTVSRADVAAVIAALLTSGHAVRHQFELISGSTPIDEALRVFS